MRYLILSDIHANLEALAAVLAAAGGYDQVLLLGDYVGYGADPNGVIDCVRALPVAAAKRIFKGAFVGLSSAGYARPPAPARKPPPRSAGSPAAS